MKTKLNIGCGARALPGWTNLDFASRPGLVVAHDLRTPLPLGDGTIDLVYHSHVLEHLDRPAAHALIGECFRVLKPGGTLRVVVPDLEQKARLYLQTLQRAIDSGDPQTLADHEWMIIELLDQMVRTRFCGEMADFIASPRAGDFVRQRIGDELFNAIRSPSVASQKSPPPRPSSPFPTLPGRCRLRVRSILEKLAARFLGVSHEELDWLKFRRHGESHLWMYDRVTLEALVSNAGFADISITDAFTSRWPGWSDDGAWLDVEAGKSRKPDSLFMEATKRS